LTEKQERTQSQAKFLTMLELKMLTELEEKRLQRFGLCKKDGQKKDAKKSGRII
jgi:hypothetical protein